MEVDFQKMREQMECTLEDIVKYDPPKLQRANFKELEETARIMCDVFHLVTRDQAIELRRMVKDARKKSKEILK